MAAAVCALVAGGAPDAASVAAAQAATAGPAILAPGWARVVVAGTLASVAPAGGVVSVSLVGPARADVFDGGTSWHTRTLAGTRAIHVLPQTVMVDSAARPIAPAWPRAGDHVAVWAVMAPDDEIMALSLVVTPARPAAPPQPASATPGHVTGVVAARSGSTLDLITDTGVRHAVVLTGTTQVRAAGAAAAPAPSPFDVLQIDGAVNSDGSLVATRVNVQFLAAQGAQVSGPIEAMEGDLDGLIVGDTMVCTSAQTYFLRGSARLWMAQMSVGRPVTVYGVPILAGKIPVGLAARVVAAK
ncbi:MAG TPA: DUF5666 domain-containing protein [bacterium]|nr:DUF5666 domain-containing protein [bacterium]